MNLYPFELEANIIQIAVLLILIIWRILRYRASGGVAGHLFLSALFAHLLLNIYWTVALVLGVDQGNLMFKASDTGAIAMFLLWFSTLQTGCSIKLKKIFRPVPLFAFFFSIWNLIWWNLWTANFITNALWAISISLFICAVFYSLDNLGGISKKYAFPLLAAILVLFIFEIPMYLFDPDTPVYIASDWICAATWLILVILCLIYAFRDRQRRTLWLFSGLIFSLCGEYLTDGIRYSLLMLAESIVLAALIIFFNEKDLGEVDAE